MNRFTLFTDISGRVSRDVTGNPRVTAATVVFSSAHLGVVTSRLSENLPKWQSCSYENAQAVIDLINDHAICAGVFSVNKNTEAWSKFCNDSEYLQSSIVSQDRHPAGFVKPSNVLAFHLLGGACAVATGHALRISSKKRIVDHSGMSLIERSLVFDSDISGEENLDVFKSFWERPGSSRLMDKAGFRFVTKNVRVATEQQEPLLYMADYIAGIAHTALLRNPGRIRLPLTTIEANTLLGQLKSTGKIAVQTADFDVGYEDVFGEAFERARNERLC